MCHQVHFDSISSQDGEVIKITVSLRIVLPLMLLLGQGAVILPGCTAHRSVPLPTGIGSVVVYRSSTAQALESPSSETLDAMQHSSGIGGKPSREMAVSKDRRLRLEYEGGIREGPLAIQLLTAAGSSTVQVPIPEARLVPRVLLSPRNDYAVIALGPDRSPATTALGALAINTRQGKLSIAREPSLLGFACFLGPINADGRFVFAITAESLASVGKLWTVSLPDCKFSLLYSQPPRQWPRSVQQAIKRGMGPPGYAKPEIWGDLLPSPDGRYLVFNSYPPEDYTAQALWLADLRTKVVQQITWQDKQGYYHTPVQWLARNEGVIFDADGCEFELRFPPSYPKS